MFGFGFSFSACYVMIKIVIVTVWITFTEFKGSPDFKKILFCIELISLKTTFSCILLISLLWIGVSFPFLIRLVQILHSELLPVCVCLADAIKTNIDCFPEAYKLQTSLKCWRNKNDISRTMPFSFLHINGHSILSSVAHSLVWLCAFTLVSFC